MARVTYNDPTGVAETVTWHGREHKAGEAFDVEDTAENQAYLNAAEANPFFTVEDRQKPDEKGQNAPPPKKFETRKLTPYERGQQAKQDGKERSIPPFYRGKDESEEWLSGYDSGVPVAAAPVSESPTSAGPTGPMSAGSSSSENPPNSTKGAPSDSGGIPLIPADQGGSPIDGASNPAQTAATGQDSAQGTRQAEALTGGPVT